MFDFLLAPFIVARRMEQMTRPHKPGDGAGPQLAAAVETQRMIVEKVAAFHMGMLAGSTEVLRATSRVTSRLMQGDALGAGFEAAGAPEKIVTAGLSPTRKTLRANARRFAKR
jgi:hypothetical protein